MQAVLAGIATSEVKNIKNELCALFDKLEGADNMTKNAIENKIVDFGDTAIEFLIDKLIGSKGTQRGIAAMSLIRIGESAIESLQKLATGNKNCTWVANYIIKEIEGTF